MVEPVRVLELLVSTDLGGGPAHVRDLAGVLPRGEFTLTVAGPAGGPYVREFEALGVEFVDASLHRVSMGAIRTLGRLTRLIRARRIQVIHSHGKGAGLYGRLAARLTGAAAVHTVHGIHYEGYRRLYLPVERWLARRGHAVVHVSESQAREATVLGLAPPGRSRVIVNGIDPSRVREAAQRERPSRSQLGLDGDAVVLGTVARFDPVKDLDVLLRAFARLLTRMPRAQLLLIGDGAEASRLRDLAARLGIRDRVVFAGRVPGAARCLPLVDLYVSASRKEGLPLAVLEAMALERAVVATRVAGHVDVVEEGETGILVPVGDPESLAAAAAGLLADPERRRALGRAGRRRVESRFTLTAMAGAVAELYREAAGFRQDPHLRGV